MSEWVYVLIFLGSVLVASVSQILLKKSANKTANKIGESRLKEYLNPTVMVAYFMFFASSLITTIAYKGVDLSTGPLLEATGYIWVTALGAYFLKEKISLRKIIGIVLIITGIMVICFL